MFESARMMVVDRPAAVCDGVIEFSAGKDIILVDDVIADISAAFPLAGQESDPVEHPVVRAVIAVVLHMIPYAESNLEQLVAHFLGVADAVLHAAQFYPVEVGVDGVQIFRIADGILIATEFQPPVILPLGKPVISFRE